MADKELVIKIRSDRSQASEENRRYAAEAKAAIADLAKAEKQAARDAAQAQKQAAREAADERKRIEREAALAARQAAKDATEAVKEEARKQAEAQRQAAKDASQAQRQLSQAQKDAARDATRTIKEEADRQAQAQKKWSSEASRAAKEAAMAQKDAARSAAATYHDQAKDATAGAGKLSAVAIGATTAVVQFALQQLKQFVAEIGNAVRQAENDAKRMTAGFGDQREQLAHLAGLEGKTADNAYTLGFGRMNARTGMTPQQSLASQEAFLNAGMQYRGKSLSDKEFDDFKEQQARLSVAKGIDASVIGDLSGRMLGVKDYSKFGEKGSEAALGDLNQAISILEAGSGDAPQLGREMTKLMAATVNEDELKGVFKGPKDAAKLISILTEGFPEGQAEAGQAALRGLRGVRGFAGITEKDTPEEAIKKLGPALEAEAAAKGPGYKVQDVIKDHVKDELSARALSVLVNKRDLFAAREDTAAAFAGPEVAGKTIADAGETDRVRRLKADADVRLAEMERGAEDSALEIRRKEATARLIRARKLGTTEGRVGDYVSDKISFGLLGDPEQRRIDAEVQAEIDRAKAAAKGGVPPAPKGLFRRALEGAGEAGIGRPGRPDDPNLMLPEDRARFLNEQLNANPPGVAVPGPAAGQPKAPGQASATVMDMQELVAAVNQVRDRLPERRVGPVIQTQPIVDTRMG